MDFFNSVIKISYVNIITYIIFIKLTNYNKNNYKKIMSAVVVSIIETIIGLILIRRILVIPVMVGIYAVYSFFISKITKNKLGYSITVALISLAIAYFIYIISTIMSAIFVRLIHLEIQESSIIIFILSVVIESLLVCYLFKIKRLKNGIPFLCNENKVRKIGFLGGMLVGIAILIYSGIRKDNAATNSWLIIGIIIEAICMFIWIKRKITKFYKQKIKENTIQELENDIKAKDELISKITDENNRIATINHKYSSRIKSLESVSTKILTKPEVLNILKCEFGEEFTDFQNQLQTISEEFSKEMSMNRNYKENLEKTGVFGIDSILECMCDEASKLGINFNCKINGNIVYMVEKVISQSRLETLLGDHIKDAIIAINCSDNSYKSILVAIGIMEGCYEVCILDSGIEFEISTLLKIGTEKITTHKDTGGSGIGFMTTFETLNETKASLIIEEKQPMCENDYTKAVRIRFDGRNEYKICSYREKKIKKQATGDRIIIENLKK